MDKKQLKELEEVEIVDLYDNLNELLAEMEKRHYVNISEVKRDISEVRFEINRRKIVSGGIKPF